MAVSTIKATQIITETHNMGAPSYTAGTQGTIGCTLTKDVSKSGYEVIGVIPMFAQSDLFTPICVKDTSSDVVRLAFPRRQAAAASTTSNFFVKIVYRKI